MTEELDDENKIQTYGLKHGVKSVWVDWFVPEHLENEANRLIANLLKSHGYEVSESWTSLTLEKTND